MDYALYDHDFYAWSHKQAGLIRDRRLAEMDADNVAEEIECLAKREKRELTSRLQLLIVLLLKWQFQPGLRSENYRSLVKLQRMEVAARLNDSPSLGEQLADLVAGAYPFSHRIIAIDTGFDIETFPKICPYTCGQIVAEDFLP